MDYSRWDIKKHVISASHIRGYRRGVQDESNAPLRLAVKEYVPIANSEVPSHAVTIVFVHGVGSTKESYEPFFHQLLASGLEIRAIWAADIAWHGRSYLLNEGVIGDEPHWDDAARDMIHLINTFQERMPPPIIGMGQSWGGYVPVSCALLHPRLFAGVVALEPFLAALEPSLVIEGGKRLGFAAITAKAMAKKKDTWKSRTEARTALLRSPYFARFDKDVFEQVIKYDLKLTGNGGEVTLTTPKAMEAMMMMRMQDREKGRRWSDWGGKAERQIAPGFYRSEPDIIKHRLKDVRPPVLYVFASESIVGSAYADWLVERTGTGEMGSGGAKKGKVELVWVEGSDHPMPLEKPKETAKAIVPWVQKLVKSWLEEAQEDRRPFWVSKVDPEYMKKLQKL